MCGAALRFARSAQWPFEGDNEELSGANTSSFVMGCDGVSRVVIVLSILMI